LHFVGIATQEVQRMFGLFGSQQPQEQQPRAARTPLASVPRAVPPLDLQIPEALLTATFANG
jgi:hypothetical protein